MIGVVVVSALYWAQVVFIPVALAVFLTFLLNPLVRVLQRRGLGRIPSVVLVVLLAALVLGGVVWLVTAEVTGLAGELPDYTENIKGKIRSLREMGRRLGTPGKDDPGDYRGVEVAAACSEGEAAGPSRPGRPSAAGKPPAVVVQPESPAWLSRLPASSARWWSRSAAWPWRWCWSCSCS